MTHSRRTPRLVDVAKQAGVSVATASLALNGKKGVIPEKRARVIAIAKELGYHANVAGQLLRSARTGMIGVYLPPTALNYGYYLEVVAGITDALHEAGLSTLLLPNLWGQSNTAFRFNVDACIVVEPFHDDPGVRMILESGLPVICAEPASSSLPAATAVVTYDHKQIMRSVLGHIEASGRTAPAFLGLEIRSEWTLLLERSYREWCEDRALTPVVMGVDPRHLLSNPLAYLEEALSPLFKTDNQLDALVIGVDLHAVSIASLCTAAGRVPGVDLALVSLVDSTLMQMNVPSITSIDLHPRELGVRCGELAAREALAVTPREDPEFHIQPHTFHHRQTS